MLRDLLTQKCAQKILVTDFGYPIACRFRKYPNLNRSPALVLPTFFKTWFLVHKIGKNWPKMVFFDFYEKVSFFIVFAPNCLGCVPRPENCEKLPKKFENWSILANFGQFWPYFSHILWIFIKFWKKLVEQGPESTCSVGVSKISNQKIFRALLG
jgi:hypothetical protein